MAGRVLSERELNRALLARQMLLAPPRHELIAAGARRRREEAGSLTGKKKCLCHQQTRVLVRAGARQGGAFQRQPQSSDRVVW